MYFKEKGNTNIDAEFENNKKLNFNLKNVKLKPLLFIVGGIILLSIIIFVIVLLINNANKYTIELIGSETITINLGSDYVEPGYKAYDKNNNDYTNQVEITNNVDTSKTGEYEILYSIDNINKVRYVIVKETKDLTYIYLNGNVTMYLDAGKKYNEPGCTVYDTIDGNITNKVKISGKVDTSKKGTYQIVYTVVNSRNITTTKVRNVIVK